MGLNGRQQTHVHIGLGHGSLSGRFSHLARASCERMEHNQKRLYCTNTSYSLLLAHTAQANDTLSLPGYEHPVNLDAFKASLQRPEPPELGPALQALWWDAQGDWDRAHACAQVDEADPSAAWVHAYLHRKEGDLANAAYWYRRAGRPMAREELTAEWLAIATALLGDV